MMKISALLLGSALSIGVANSGTLEIKDCSLGNFTYDYSVTNGDNGVLQLGSLTDENISLSPSTVDAGSGSNEHDLTDDMPDSNVFVTLIDGDEIITRLCQTEAIAP